MEEQISTNEVMDLLINEGNVTTLAIEQVYFLLFIFHLFLIF